MTENVVSLWGQPIEEALSDISEYQSSHGIRSMVVTTVNEDGTVSCYRSGDYRNQAILMLGVLEDVKMSFFLDCVEHTAKAYVDE